MRRAPAAVAAGTGGGRATDRGGGGDRHRRRWRYKRAAGQRGGRRGGRGGTARGERGVFERGVACATSRTSVRGGGCCRCGLVMRPRGQEVCATNGGGVQRPRGPAHPVRCRGLGVPRPARIHPPRGRGVRRPWGAVAARAHAPSGVSRRPPRGVARHGAAAAAPKAKGGPPSSARGDRWSHGASHHGAVRPPLPHRGDWRVGHCRARRGRESPL